MGISLERENPKMMTTKNMNDKPGEREKGIK
jgi:hypothetical protein